MNKHTPDIKATRPNGRPMANSGGLDRVRRRLRRQIKAVLRKTLDFSE